MVRAMCGMQCKDRKRFDVHVGLELNHRSVGYGKQCSLALSCVEERRWSYVENGIKFQG